MTDSTCVADHALFIYCQGSFTKVLSICGRWYKQQATRVESCPPDIRTAMKLFGYLNIQGAFTLILQYFGHLKYTILVVFSWDVDRYHLRRSSLSLSVYFPPPPPSVLRFILLVCWLLFGSGLSHITEDSVRIFPGRLITHVIPLSEVSE